MIILPAIDILNAKAVRLTKGDYNKVKIYGDPDDFARRFVEEGATDLHVVDLDGAREGSTRNYETIKTLCLSGLKVEVGGGIRNMDRIKAYLDAGATRVILGTAAVNDKDFLSKAIVYYPNNVAVGVDAKDGKVATHGWETITRIPSYEFCSELKDMGVKTVIYTDIATDGNMQGTNLAAFETLSKIGLDIIASGGITYEYELAELKKIGVYGAIVGKAIYENLLDLKSVMRYQNAD